ncbi:helix-turn-helix domain-containing protein [Butyrivibrio sp. NC2007]|uniref:helix-turn-helix domain-containing protein n=1 Tax=Butyrivibrio sp. NC2007 TaxID=1280683 RepID=UPI0003B6C24B|nr:helix-turn-helix transcriptional regulator [Butyrivibrio sp. NC2007]
MFAYKLDTTIDCKKVGERIRDFRLLRGLTQDDLGGMLGTDGSNISGYERGQRGEMGIGMLMRISKALKVHPEDLLQDETEATDIGRLVELLDPQDKAIIENLVRSLLSKRLGEVIIYDEKSIISDVQL